MSRFSSSSNDRENFSSTKGDGARSGSVEGRTWFCFLEGCVKFGFFEGLEFGFLEGCVDFDFFKGCVDFGFFEGCVEFWFLEDIKFCSVGERMIFSSGRGKVTFFPAEGLVMFCFAEDEAESRSAGDTREFTTLITNFLLHMKDSKPLCNEYNV